MSNDTRIAVILGSAMLIAAGTAWYCRNDDATKWKQKYQQEHLLNQEQKNHENYKFNKCVQQLAKR